MKSELLLIRARLMDELIEDGLNVAIPTNECGADMLAFLPTAPVNRQIVVVPIQVRAAFDFAPYNQKIPADAALLIVYVLLATVSRHSFLLAFTQPELLTVTKVMQIATISRSAMQNELLAPFMMSPGKWRKKIQTLVHGVEKTTAPTLALPHLMSY